MRFALGRNPDPCRAWVRSLGVMLVSACAASSPAQSQDAELIGPPPGEPPFVDSGHSEPSATPGWSTDCHEDGWALGPETLAPTCNPIRCFNLRHSSTHGRAIGYGGPLRGTSWLNRPYEFSLEFGSLIMTGKPAERVRSGNDMFAALNAGWDWDHYWGGQFRIGWSSPELDNTAVDDEELGDNFFITDASVLYYPWGDSRTRPFLRLGVGLTDIEFTNASRVRQREQLFTIPMGIGIKYQFRRWLAWRAEFANNLAIGQNNAETMDNMTLTLGFEGRFGGRPTGYWAWHPRGHGW